MGGENAGHKCWTDIQLPGILCKTGSGLENIEILRNSVLNMFRFLQRYLLPGENMRDKKHGVIYRRFIALVSISIITAIVVILFRFVCIFQQADRLPFWDEFRWSPVNHWTYWLLILFGVILIHIVFCLTDLYTGYRKAFMILTEIPLLLYGTIILYSWLIEWSDSHYWLWFLLTSILIVIQAALWVLIMRKQKFKKKINKISLLVYIVVLCILGEIWIVFYTLAIFALHGMR